MCTHWRLEQCTQMDNRDGSWRISSTEKKNDQCEDILHNVNRARRIHVRKVHEKVEIKETDISTAYARRNHGNPKVGEDGGGWFCRSCWRMFWAVQKAMDWQVIMGLTPEAVGKTLVSATNKPFTSHVWQRESTAEDEGWTPIRQLPIWCADTTSVLSFWNDDALTCDRKRSKSPSPWLPFGENVAPSLLKQPSSVAPAAAIILNPFSAPALELSLSASEIL